MATQVTYVGDGATVTYAIPFDYDGDDLNVTVDAAPVSFSLDNSSTVRLQSAPRAGAGVRVFRKTPFDNPEVVFADSSILSADDLNSASGQLFRKVQEVADDNLAVSSRALLAPEGEVLGDMPSAVARAGKVLAFDGTGEVAPMSQEDFRGPTGNTGPANSTYPSLAEMKKAPKTNLSYLLVTPTGALGYSFVEGNFVGKADDIFVVALDAVPLAQGALVRDATVVSVKDIGFGARGDGVTNDTAAIQKAIDFVASRGGGTVLLPVGTYRVSLSESEDKRGASALTMRSNVTLEGSNRFSSIIKLANAQFGAGAFTRVIASNGRVQNVVLRDFTVDGNRAGQGMFAAQGNGGNILLEASTALVDGVVSIEANGQGIQVIGSPTNPGNTLTITGCIVRGTSGSTLDSEGNVTVAQNGNGCGIQVSWFFNYRIVHNDTSATWDNGIDTFSDDGSNSTVGGYGIIAHNIITNGRVGVFPETSSRVIVAFNQIAACREGGIAVNRIFGAPSRVLVQGNQIEHVPVGIRVFGDAESVRIEGNTIGFITTAAGSGILLSGTSYVLVKGNEFNIAYTNVPLVACVGPQVAFVTISGNWYFGTPDPGYLTYIGASSVFKVITEDWRPVHGEDRAAEDGERMLRNRATIKSLRADSLAVTGTVGFNGATPKSPQAVPAEATDLTTTTALVNAIRTALIGFGLAT